MASPVYTIRTLLDAFPGLSEHAVRRAIKLGRLEAHQLAGQDAMLWVTQQAVDRWLEESRVTPGSHEGGGLALVAACADTDFDFDY